MTEKRHTRSSGRAGPSRAGASRKGAFAPAQGYSEVPGFEPATSAFRACSINVRKP